MEKYIEEMILNSLHWNPGRTLKGLLMDIQQRCIRHTINRAKYPNLPTKQKEILPYIEAMVKADKLVVYKRVFPGGETKPGYYIGGTHFVRIP